MTTKQAAGGKSTIYVGEKTLQFNVGGKNVSLPRTSVLPRNDDILQVYSEETAEGKMNTCYSLDSKDGSLKTFYMVDSDGNVTTKVNGQEESSLTAEQLKSYTLQDRARKTASISNAFKCGRNVKKLNKALNKERANKVSLQINVGRE